MTTLAPVPSLDELRRAYRAVRSGEFSAHPRTSSTAATHWTPRADEHVMLVCGCGGNAGASAIALALATVAGRARVVECCGSVVSGLAYAASAELGTGPDGWTQGSRDEVIVQRRAEQIVSLSSLPVPADSQLPVSVVDCAWDPVRLLESSGWLGELARIVPRVVLVTRATVPGFRRLEVALEAVGEARAVVAVVGPKRWPRVVDQAAGMGMRRVQGDGRFVRVPVLPALAISGLTPDPLPAALTRAAVALLTLLEGAES